MVNALHLRRLACLQLFLHLGLLSLHHDGIVFDAINGRRQIDDVEVLHSPRIVLMFSEFFPKPEQLGWSLLVTCSSTPRVATAPGTKWTRSCNKCNLRWVSVPLGRERATVDEKKQFQMSNRCERKGTRKSNERYPNSKYTDARTTATKMIWSLPVGGMARGSLGEICDNDDTFEQSPCFDWILENPTDQRLLGVRFYPMA